MTWLLFAEAAVPEGGLFDLDATLAFNGASGGSPNLSA